MEATHPESKGKTKFKNRIHVKKFLNFDCLGSVTKKNCNLRGGGVKIQKNWNFFFERSLTWSNSFQSRHFSVQFHGLPLRLSKGHLHRFEVSIHFCFFPVQKWTIRAMYDLKKRTNPFHLWVFQMPYKLHRSEVSTEWYLTTNKENGCTVYG